MTELEQSVLMAISDGRVKKEMDGIIRFMAEREHKVESYYSVTRSLMKKFDAFTIAHVIYKAMKVGIIE